MSTPNYDQAKLASIKTYMLIAFIFTIIAMIIFLIGGLWEIYAYSVFASLYYSIYIYGAGYATGFLVSAIVMLVFAGFAFYLFFFKIRKMYNAAGTGDVNTLKSLNNMMWAILCLIFTRVIPGIMMLIAYGPINELGKAAPPPPPPS